MENNIQDSTSPEQPTSQTSHPITTASTIVPNKNTRSLVLTVLSTILLILLVLIGFFALQNYQQNKVKKTLKQVSNTPKEFIKTPIPSTAPSYVPSTTPSTETSVDTTVNWLTYENNNIPLTFKYPKEVELKEGNSIQLILWGPSQKEDTEFYDGISLSISLPFNIQNTQLKDYVIERVENSAQNSEISQPMSEVSLGQLSGYTYAVRGLGEFQYYFLQPSDKSWTVEIIDGTNDPTSQGFQQTTDAILSTLSYQ